MLFWKLFTVSVVAAMFLSLPYLCSIIICMYTLAFVPEDGDSFQGTIKTTTPFENVPNSTHVTRLTKFL